MGEAAAVERAHRLELGPEAHLLMLALVALGDPHLVLWL